jgi:rare lipoprotein A
MSRTLGNLAGVLAAGLLLVSSAIAAEETPVPPPTVERAPGGEPVVVHEGEASYYGPGFHGRKTATGEIFNQDKLTAASTELPLGTRANVTNLENGRTVEVRVNDRGPYADGRVIDLSKAAARKLDMVRDGVAEVRVELKPSAQPTAKSREKVERKAEQMLAAAEEAVPAMQTAAN